MKLMIRHKLRFISSYDIYSSSKLNLTRMFSFKMSFQIFLLVKSITAYRTNIRSQSTMNHHMPFEVAF